MARNDRLKLTRDDRGAWTVRLLSADGRRIVGRYRAPAAEIVAALRPVTQAIAAETHAADRAAELARAALARFPKETAR